MPARKDDDLQFLSFRLRILREQANLTQEDFAEHAGIGYKDYQNIEAGRRWSPQWNSVRKLAAVHGLTIRQLLGEKTPTTKLAWKRPLHLPKRKRRRADR